MNVRTPRRRGNGRGNGGPIQGNGGASKCVCPKCGHSQIHIKGVPCTSSLCPKCGTKMIGE